MCANAIVYPLDWLATRSQIEAKQQKGSVYAGMTFSLAQTFASNYLFFLHYQCIRNSLVARIRLSVSAELLTGALAGLLSRLWTTPLSVLATRRQTGCTSYHHALSQVLKTDGVLGLWNGFGASAILTVNPAITYGLLQAIQTGLKSTKPLTVIQVFLLGSFTKALATIVSTLFNAAYPFILAKIRMQAGHASSVNMAFRKMFKSGVLGFYVGLPMQLLKAVTCQGLLVAIQHQLLRK